MRPRDCRTVSDEGSDPSASVHGTSEEDYPRLGFHYPADQESVRLDQFLCTNERHCAYCNTPDIYRIIYKMIVILNEGYHAAVGTT